MHHRCVLFNKLKLTHVSNRKGVSTLITPESTDMKIEKLRELFFNTPSVDGEKKTEEEFKICYLSYEFAELKKVANTNYKRPPKNYEEKVQRYNELKQLLGGA